MKRYFHILKITIWCLLALLPLSNVSQADPVTRHIYANWCPGYGFRLESEGACPVVSFSNSIAFTDLINGPASGLDDGNGSGAIVTVWGWFGSSQGISTIEFCDSTSTCRTPHVYYWKNADGTLPGGPANLYESHGMTEIAFSIPAGSALGEGTIKITYDGIERTEPFTVRTGNIYHVMSTGSDGGNDGSYDEPFLTADYAVDNTPAGSTIYIHDVDTGNTSADTALYKNEGEGSTQSAQLNVAAYPGYQPTVTGQRAVQSYGTGTNAIEREAIVWSKLSVFSSGHSGQDANGQPTGAIHSGKEAFGIQTSAFGRVVGNKVTEMSGGCSSETAGAIHGLAQYRDFISDAKVYGNLIHDYGCYGSDKLHHTTYFRIRSDSGGDKQLPPPHVAYNYLKNNYAKNGIHFHDQGEDCGDFTSDVHINNNVVLNQAGAGIAYQTSGCDRTEDVRIYNNVVMNAGMPADWDGIDPQSSIDPDINGITIWDSGLLGTMYIHNNTIIGWDRYDITDGEDDRGGAFGFWGGGDNVRVEFYDNVCVAIFDSQFINYGYNAENKTDNIFGSNNLFYYVGDSPNIPAIFSNPAPGYDRTNPTTPLKAVTPITEVNMSGHIYGDPLLTISGARIIDIGAGSPILDISTTGLTGDVYGKERTPPYNIGAVE